MNRDELNAFFAKADDVLIGWQGSSDAYRWRAPEIWADWEPICRTSLVGQIAHDNGLDGWAAEAEADRLRREAAKNITAGIARLGDAFIKFGSQITAAMASLGALHQPRLAPTPASRALTFHQNRNTGPVPQSGLDGTMRQPRSNAKR